MTSDERMARGWARLRALLETEGQQVHALLIGEMAFRLKVESDDGAFDPLRLAIFVGALDDAEWQMGVVFAAKAVEAWRAKRPS